MMKSKLLRPILSAVALAAAAWTAVAYSAEPAGTTTEPSMSDSRARRAALARMEQEQKRIVERLQISAPMEIELENGIDPVMEAYENGFIIEATLEEVEAALAAAAATPDEEDDKRAMRLRHRGSYRFFLPETDRDVLQRETR